MRDGLFQLLGRFLADADVDLRVRVHIARQHPRQDRAGDRMLDADVDALLAGETRAAGLVEFLLELDHLLGRLQEELAVLRQPQGAAAHQQLGAELALELRDLFGQRLLGEEQMLRGRGEASLLRDGDKAVDQGEIHRFTPKSLIIISLFWSITPFFARVNLLFSFLFVTQKIFILPFSE